MELTACLLARLIDDGMISDAWQTHGVWVEFVDHVFDEAAPVGKLRCALGQRDGVATEARPDENRSAANRAVPCRDVGRVAVPPKRFSDLDDLVGFWKPFKHDAPELS